MSTLPFSHPVAALLTLASHEWDGGGVVSELDCRSYIAILPTFHSMSMRDFYAKNPDVPTKLLIDKIRTEANLGDKGLQFTYSQLLFNGYCVPKDVCAAVRYLKKSRGGAANWELIYPLPLIEREAALICQ